ncbi:hypothetical protein, partial [Streptomyces sp. JV190]|uniref:hypothetical protein n=1 Tax=Streptomyces sp. JV190 TaxID=3002533 RepID=UPI002E789E8B
LGTCKAVISGNVSNVTYTNSTGELNITTGSGLKVDSADNCAGLAAQGWQSGVYYGALAAGALIVLLPALGIGMTIARASCALRMSSGSPVLAARASAICASSSSRRVY